MAAYASLLSLGHILDRILQHPPRQRPVLDKTQIVSLLENLSFLQKFLEDFSLIRGDEIQALEEVIARSAYAAEHITERRVVDQILEYSEAASESSSTLFCQDLQNVIEELDYVKKGVVKIKKTEGIQIMEQPRKAATSSSSTRGASHGKNTMVGFDKDLIQIMETLTGHQSNLRFISIVGMGGIGKTTLARNVYHNPLIEQYFHLHAWATISREYSVTEILSALLKGIGVLAECRKEEGGEKITQATAHELGERLHKSLCGRKYLIVMDDVWSTEVWDDIKMFFPDNNNGSRIMVTTRLSNVADKFRSSTPHGLRILDEDQSWFLFCDKVFGEESCPTELEKVGKTIVGNCKGLPLAIVSISGLLAKSSQTVEYWEHVANDTNAALHMGGDGHCYEILSSSYKHLPVHLKPCFLSMARFPEDSVIRVSKLVKLWVAEGILKPMRDKSLEEIAEDNLKDLIDRNLVMIDEYGSRSKIKTCTIHDLIRDLCRRESEKEKFFLQVQSFDKYRDIIHRNCLHIIQRSSNTEDCQQKVSDTRSLACELKFKIGNKDYIFSYDEIVQFFSSRYIDRLVYFCFHSNSFELLAILWNLQTITIRIRILPDEQPMYLPAELWEMPQLRHLKLGPMLRGFYLPDPPCSYSKNGIVLKNLQTLCYVRNFSCTDEVVHRIPNLKKLGIIYRRDRSLLTVGFGQDDHEVPNLSVFPNLESLLYSYLDTVQDRSLLSGGNLDTVQDRSLLSGGFGQHDHEVPNLSVFLNLESLLLNSYLDTVLRNLYLPHSLKKLTLKCCRACWEDLTEVGSLPHLEVLNLMSYAVIGRKWNPVKGQFLELKSLRIDVTDLVEWIADSSHFPRLEKLELSSLIYLKEIPYGIGDIQTLRSISLKFCTASANESAKIIQEEQQNLGNYDLRLRFID